MYYNNYFKAISEGMEKTSYCIDSLETTPDDFFLKIKQILKHLNQKNNRIFFFGNGASASFANHMALDFSKNGKILSRSLSDSSLLTALSNDFSYENAMVEFLKIEGIAKDDLSLIHI